MSPILTSGVQCKKLPQAKQASWVLEYEPRP
jgi:hypothetical protein